jgi:osmotically-inducible protein OsmY
MIHQFLNKKGGYMKKLILVPLIVLAFSVVFMACNKPGADEARRGEKAKMADSDLEKSIRAKLDSDQQIKAADLRVNADADKNEVTLSGTVKSEALRTKAVELANSAHSGLMINDKVDVKPREISRKDYTEELAREERTNAKQFGEEVGDKLDDAWIHAKIVAKLIGNSTTPERKINVDVVDNVVTLRGKVENAEQKSEAERVAKETEGVKQVRNQLKVSA